MKFYFALFFLFCCQVANAQIEKSNKVVRVLQNRYFLKAMRPEVSAFFGTVLNETYSDTKAVGARFGLFFNEWVGIEYSYSHFIARDSEDLEAIHAIRYCPDNTDCTNKDAERKVLDPSFNRFQQSHTVAFSIAPVYGKVNFLDAYILYSDIYAIAGVTFLKSKQGSDTAPTFGLGQRFYFAKRYSVRLDATDILYNERRENFGQVSKTLTNSWTMSAGFSVFLTDEG